MVRIRTDGPWTGELGAAQPARRIGNPLPGQRRLISQESEPDLRPDRYTVQDDV